MSTTKKKARKKSGKQSSNASSTKPKSHGTCFVMMPFKDPFNIYYDAIFKPAINKANLDPVRADDLFRPSVIVSDLWQMIQRAKLLLAELTTKNANVFYELGLAHAIGKPVILVSETMDDVPFDLQQLRVLLYNKNDPVWGEKLSIAITNSIIETLGNPVEAVPSIFRKTVASQAPEQDTTAARLAALESQMRILLAREPLRSTIGGPWEEELKHIHGPAELDNWMERWRGRNIPLRILRRAAARADNIPDLEAERLGRVASE
ncbi:MAG: hypothetical protein JXA69_12780 [Phycisphaerae bacterium]|nr:hypothetical protein [Phycisphaerae bacterium]